MFQKSGFILLVIIFVVCISCVYAGDNNTASGYVVNQSVPVSDEKVYALEDGHLNTSFSDMSNGYCLEYGEQEARIGDEFYKKDTSYAVNNVDDKLVGDYLKTYFVRYYNHAMGDTVRTQHMIWHFTDNFDGWRLNYTIINDIKSNPLSLPDEGYVRFNDTHYLFFKFNVLLSPYENHQDYFTYRIWFDTVLPIWNGTCLNDTVDEGLNISNSIKNESNTVIHIRESIQSIGKNNVHAVNARNIELNKHLTGVPIKILTIILIILMVGILVVVDKRKNMKKKKE